MRSSVARRSAESRVPHDMKTAASTRWGCSAAKSRLRWQPRDIVTGRRARCRSRRGPRRCRRRSRPRSRARRPPAGPSGRCRGDRRRSRALAARSTGSAPSRAASARSPRAARRRGCGLPRRTPRRRSACRPRARVALGVGVAGAALLAGRLPGGSHAERPFRERAALGSARLDFIQASISDEQRRVAFVDARKAARARIPAPWS